MKLDTRLKTPIDSIQPHPRNVRQGDIGAISLSLEQHGQYLPVTVQESTNYILRGNHTWRAMKSLGWTHCAAQFIDVDDDTALRIMLVDNRTNDLASYNDPELADLLIELSETELKLLGTGFDGDFLEELLKDLDEPLHLEGAGDERYTPQWLFEAMGVEFDIDLAAPPGGIPYIPAKRYFTKADNGLEQDWTGLSAWCNPPFSIAADFGRKWLGEITEGVWLGPLSHATEYRVQLMQTSEAIWIPNKIEFVMPTGNEEGIGFPVFVAGFGSLGGQAMTNLHKTAADRGIAFLTMKN